MSIDLRLRSYKPKWFGIKELISKHYTADELRQIIIKHRDRFPYLTRMETGVNWLHIDVFNLPVTAPEGTIMLFSKSGNVKYV